MILQVSHFVTLNGFLHILNYFQVFYSFFESSWPNVSAVHWTKNSIHIQVFIIGLWFYIQRLCLTLTRRVVSTQTSAAQNFFLLFSIEFYGIPNRAQFLSSPAGRRVTEESTEPLNSWFWIIIMLIVAENGFHPQAFSFGRSCDVRVVKWWNWWKSRVSVCCNRTSLFPHSCTASVQF